MEKNEKKQTLNSIAKSRALTFFSSKKLFLTRIFEEKKKIVLTAFVVLSLVAISVVVFLVATRISQKKGEYQKRTQERISKDSFFGQLIGRPDSGEEEELPISSSSPTPSSISTPTLVPSSTPTPVITGSIIGETRVSYYLYSKPMAGIEVTASGENFNKTTLTKNDGSYHFDQLPIGYYTISFSHPDYRFGNVKIQVNQGENFAPGSVLGLLKNPQPLNLSINAFSDNNSNGNKDAGEEGLRATVTIYRKSGSDWQNHTSFSGDNQGNYSLSIIQNGEYKIEPGRYTFYNQPGSQFFTVDGYGGNKSFSFAYVPTVSQGGMIIFVFNDKNENLTKDAGEEYIHYQYARVTNTNTGTSNNLAVANSGMEYLNLEYGLYNLQLIPENSSWDYHYKITKGNASVNITSNSGQQKVELGAHKLY